MTEPRALSTRAVALICVLPAVVIVACRYPPFTDFPQHAAVAAILDHLGDPGFDHYELALGRTLYWLPYALTWLLGKPLGVELALRVVVALSAISVPLGVLAIVRATERPAAVALLALPLVFNRALFFGFHHFLLAIGLALAGHAGLIAPRWSKARACACTLAAIASATTHVYGLALLLAMTAVHAAFGDRARLRSRALVLAPALAGSLAWAWLAAAAPGYGATVWPPAAERLAALPAQILGGYRDRTEGILLALVGIAAALGGGARWLRPRGWPPWQRAAVACLAGNLVLYFVLPEHTPTAKFLHGRHAILAALFVPLATDLAGPGRARVLAGWLALAAAALALTAAALHFRAFDREARSFDAIVDAIPPDSRVVGLIVDPSSDAVAGVPYLHFPAYVQAREGGLPAISFPRLFWNLPVAMRADANVPPTPVDFEWHPEAFDDQRFGWAYGWAIVRAPGDRPRPPSRRFPFHLVLQSARWQLYRRGTP